MLNRSFSRHVGKWLAIAALVGSGLAMAQTTPSEPTLNQVYEAAHAGKLEQAQVMMQQVLVAHPNSAKAHFVQAELSAQQGQLGRARESLALAEKLAPGLPFAKADAVHNLRTQLTSQSNGTAVTTRPVAAMTSPAPAAPASSVPWGLVLALGGGAIAVVILLNRKKQAQPVMAPQGFGQPNAMGSGLSGPQSFGAGSGMPAQGYGQPPYGQPYGQPAGSGMGGRVMGGLATGLAVGAGVMAAQAIGKSLMGNDDHPGHSPAAANNGGNNGYEPFAGNNDLGGQNFGVADAGSWDDGGTSMASNGDGGGDWDS